MIRVYVAGPFDSPNVIVVRDNIHNAIRAADKLLVAGYAPFVPHLCHAWHALFYHDREEWLRYDREFLEVCHVLLRLPGKSAGADDEVQRMRVLGRPVYRDVDQLIQGYKTKKAGG